MKRLAMLKFSSDLIKHFKILFWGLLKYVVSFRDTIRIIIIQIKKRKLWELQEKEWFLTKYVEFFIILSILFMFQNKTYFFFSSFYN